MENYTFKTTINNVKTLDNLLGLVPSHLHSNIVIYRDAEDYKELFSTRQRFIDLSQEYDHVVYGIYYEANPKERSKITSSYTRHNIRTSTTS